MKRNENESFRRNQRIESLNLSIFSSSSNSPKLNQFILSKITRSFDLIMSNESENKIHGIELLHECILSYQKYVISMLTEEIIQEICSFSEDSTGFTLSLNFLSHLIESDPNFYQFLLNYEYYHKVINSFTLELSSQRQKALLSFICSSIENIPDSLLLMIEFGLIEAVRSINQDQFIQQMQLIYSSLFISSSDMSFLDNLLYYLKFPKCQLKIDTFDSIIKCISRDNILPINYEALFLDQRILNELSNPDPLVVSQILDLYSICCTASDHCVGVLFTNNEVINHIFSYLSTQDESLLLSCLKLFDALVSNSETASNSSHIYQLFINFNMANLILSDELNYQCRFIISQSYLKLCNHLTEVQLEPILNPLILEKTIDVFDTDDDKRSIFICHFRTLFSKFQSNEHIISMLRTLILENDSFGNLIDFPIE